MKRQEHEPLPGTNNLQQPHTHSTPPPPSLALVSLTKNNHARSPCSTHAHQQLYSHTHKISSTHTSAHTCARTHTHAHTHTQTHLFDREALMSQALVRLIHTHTTKMESTPTLKPTHILHTHTHTHTSTHTNTPTHILHIPIPTYSLPSMQRSASPCQATHPPGPSH